MGRALEQRSGQYLDALSHLGDLNPEAEGPEAFGVPEAARAVAVAVPLREFGEAEFESGLVPRLGRVPVSVPVVACEAPLRSCGKLPLRWTVPLRPAAAAARMWPIRTRMVGRPRASVTMNRCSSGSRTSDVTVTMPWMS